MKFVHLSDLHLGKRVNEYSMLDDQRHILSQITDLIEHEKPDAVFIAGDVYDKSAPAAEAVELCDDFLVKLSGLGTQLFVISGNHDSPERLAFGCRLMDTSGVHMSPVYGGDVRPFTLQDQYGPVNIYMLPFLKPVHVRLCFPEEQSETYTEALRTAVEQLQINEDERNILVTHQFVTGSRRCESEEVSVGGSDNVDASVFAGFDYTALGHLHSPQNCLSPKIRYCGSPLKYSFSEADDRKSLTVGELAAKGSLTLREAELRPLHDMREIKGLYNELTLKSYYENTSYQEDYLHVTLTDEDDVPDAIGRLRSIYHNLVRLDYDNKRTRRGAEIAGVAEVESKQPLELFSDFYKLQNNRPLSGEQREFMKELLARVWEEELA